MPCQEWDIDPDTLGTGLPPQAAGKGAQLRPDRIPGHAGATLARGYRAFDEYSRDRHAILGRARRGSTGSTSPRRSSGSGFKIAPAVGMCMAELITEGRAKTVDIEAFGLRRFAEGRTVEGAYPDATRPDYVDPRSGRVRRETCFTTATSWDSSHGFWMNVVAVVSSPRVAICSWWPLDRITGKRGRGCGSFRGSPRRRRPGGSGPG